MNRRLTAAFAALEALLVVGIGIGLPLAVLTLMWALQFGFQLDWLVFWRAAVDVWLVGHGVDVRIVLDPAAGAELGLALEPFPVTLALLGGAVLTAGAGVVLGGRLREQPHRGLGAGIAVVGVVLLSWLATTSAGHPVAQPDVTQGTVFPAAVFALGLLVGLLMAEARSVARSPGATGAPARPASAGGRLAAVRAALDATAAAARRRTERGAQARATASTTCRAGCWAPSRRAGAPASAPCSRSSSPPRCSPPPPSLSPTARSSRSTRACRPRCSAASPSPWASCCSCRPRCCGRSPGSRGRASRSAPARA